jgi:hypothetical protein
MLTIFILSYLFFFGIKEGRTRIYILFIYVKKYNIFNIISKLSLINVDLTLLIFNNTFIFMELVPTRDNLSIL